MTRAMTSNTPFSYPTVLLGHVPPPAGLTQCRMSYGKQGGYVGIYVCP